MALNDLRLMNVRKDLDALHHAIKSVSGHIQIMNSSAGNWQEAPDALQTHLSHALQDAIRLNGQVARTIAEAKTLASSAPSSPPRSLRPGQPSAPPLAAELGGKIRRLQIDVTQLDRSLRRYNSTVHSMVNDPMRHSALAGVPDLGSIATPLTELVGQISDVVSIIQGFFERRKRR